MAAFFLRLISSASLTMHSFGTPLSKGPGKWLAVVLHTAGCVRQHSARKTHTRNVSLLKKW